MTEPILLYLFNQSLFTQYLVGFYKVPEVVFSAEDAKLNKKNLKKRFCMLQDTVFCWEETNDHAYSFIYLFQTVTNASKRIQKGKSYVLSACVGEGDYFSKRDLEAVAGEVLLLTHDQSESDCLLETWRAAHTLRWEPAGWLRAGHGVCSTGGRKRRWLVGITQDIKQLESYFSGGSY
jgi:hypothetical protein